MTIPKPEHVAAALRAIMDMNDPDRLRRMIVNAKEKGIEEVESAAFEKLIEILPDEKPGTFEYDIWKTIHAFEELLKQERGRTVRLSRTRQKISKDGVRKVLEDFATHPSSTEGYDMLIARGLPDLTGEAVVLRHQHEFSSEIIAAAEARLRASEVDVGNLRSE